MPSGRRTTGNGTKRQCREFVELMKNDPTLGCKIGEAVYTVRGNTGKYLVTQRTVEKDTFARVEVEAVYITDFMQMIYDAGKEAKAVKV